MSKPLIVTSKIHKDPIIIGLPHNEGERVIVRRAKERPPQTTVKVVNGHVIRVIPHGEK